MTFSLPYGIKPTFITGRAVTGGFSVFDDFLAGGTSGAADTGLWLETTTGSNALKADADGGWRTLTTGTSDNNIESIQANAENFHVTQDRGLYFETRISLGTVTSDTFIGMSVISADPIDTEPSDYIAFKTAGDGDLLVATRRASSTTVNLDTGFDLVAATTYVLAFEYKRDGKVHFYVDGAQVAAVSSSVATGVASIPLDKYVAPIVSIQSVAAAAVAMDVDYVFAGTDERD